MAELLLTITSYNALAVIGFILMGIYFTLYKKNKLFGNLMFIFIAVGSFTYTQGTDLTMLSLIAVVVTIGNLLFDFYNVKESY